MNRNDFNREVTSVRETLSIIIVNIVWKSPLELNWYLLNAMTGHEREYERAEERWSHSIDYNRNERIQRRINVSKDPTSQAHVCGCIWHICGRARPETVVIPVLIRLPVKLLPVDRHFVACQPCARLLYDPPDNHNATRPPLLSLLSFYNTRVSQKYA